MIKKLAIWILIKGGEMNMAAVLLASQIIRNKFKYVDVPSTLKDRVKEILKDEGLEELAQ
ncbi:hypothetical protein BK128_21465 [Viridibacillus sp. FSL H7-0596]|uniref:CD1375 family protein n=1 Tax=Viridibacillus sp. FSL H7-0596 TaxID=1928923 RepID=UPI00096D5AF9|nr:hypothetical protein [Viridibacillus sp. FSL H7-0596]OMC81841.1 hypothetical protein BK128_21465 [Viridibacillus sp. FSL H7-0596]